MENKDKVVDFSTLNFESTDEEVVAAVSELFKRTNRTLVPFNQPQMKIVKIANEDTKDVENAYESKGDSEQSTVEVEGEQGTEEPTKA